MIDLSWGGAFVLGAVVSPTDPLAATSIGRRYGVPRRPLAIIEGESLVNDGTALVLFKFAVAAVVTGTFSLAHASRASCGRSSAASVSGSSSDMRSASCAAGSTIRPSR